MVRTRGLLAVALAAPIALWGGCQRNSPASSPYAQALAAKLDRLKSAPDERGIVRKFYADRRDAPAWHDHKGRGRKVPFALASLRLAEDHGLTSAAYGELELTARAAAHTREPSDSGPSPQAIADLDVDLTTAVLQLATHVAMGRHDPAVIDRRWNARRQAPDVAAALNEALAKQARDWLDRVRPIHPEYAALQKALAQLRGQQAAAWTSIPRVSLRLGQTDTAVPALRARLAAGGYLAGDALASTRYDTILADAVRRFQEHHALPANGVLDRATIDALNVPLAARIAQVSVNLERWRWLPDDLGTRHLMVNVPQFHLIIREQGTPVMDIRVVVGKRGDETPLFSDKMTEIVFSPYWNIPETIALEETVPAIARDPDYLARNNMEIINAAGAVIPTSAVPWDDEAGVRGFSFRQRPGATNALGYVKFLFPNKHNVYLHDTPADALFKRIGRAFSHGCVRVEEPETLAQYVLRDQLEWTPDRISAAMRAGDERHVKLTEAIPIHIVYMTAWVDANGGLHFQNDVYGYDATQARAGANHASPTAETAKHR
jgi:murein L,D-transpeptidase YcbB/YkuD